MRSHAARVVGALAGALLAAGCASDPYWSKADREAAEARDRAEAASQGRTGPPPAPAAPRTEPIESRPAVVAPVEASAAPRPVEPVDVAPPPAPRPVGAIDESELEEPEPAAYGAPSPDDLAVQEAYDAALDLFQRGDAAAAESAFRDFLRRHESSDLADNAQYWIAEGQLKRGEREAALAEFRQVVERYPTGNKVPDALLKIGRTLAELGDRALAAEVYDELIQRFPENAAAETARGLRAALTAP
jgi:tol-pal system protein YbgF